MAIEVTNSTVVKIVVRRGQNSDRLNVVLSNGELGYAQDIQRLYIGDGVTLGGVPAGTRCFGITTNRSSLAPIAENGDIVFDDTNKTLFTYLNSNWRNIHPSFSQVPGASEVFTQQSGGSWTLSPSLFEDPFTYQVLGVNLNSLESISKGSSVGVDLNIAYSSLSTNRGPGNFGAWYFGDVRQTQTPDKLGARVNIEDSAFLIQRGNNPNVLRLHSAAASNDNRTTIEATSGIFDIKGKTQTRLFANNINSVDINASAATGGQVRLRNTGGTVSNPNFLIDGPTRFVSETKFDSDATIMGNLSVLGDLTYLDTIVSTTSALSVVNTNPFSIPLHVAQLDLTDSQIVSRFIGRWDVLTDFGNDIYDIFFIRDGHRDTGYGGFVSVNGKLSENTTTCGANFVVSGTSRFGPIDGRLGDNVYIQSSNDSFIQLHPGSGNIRLGNNVQFWGNNASQTPTAASTNTVLILDAANVIRSRTIDSTAWNASANYLVGPNLTLNFVPKRGSGAGTSGDPANLINSRISDNGTTILLNGNTDIGTTGGGFNLRVHGSSETTGAVRTNTSFNVNGVTITSGTAGTISLINIGDVGTTAARAGAINCTSVNASQDVVAFSSSDKKLKLNITPITSAVDKLNIINGVEFDWDEKAQSLYKGHDIGVIAQEVEAIIPQAVKTREDGTKGVRYEKIIPLLVEAIKELNSKIKESK